jgi:MFS family permease
VALMITAFIDMIGLLMVIPLLPFYATRLGGTGTVVGFLVSAFSVAQLLSAPMWGPLLRPLRAPARAPRGARGERRWPT